jgi:hypothetical protein
VPDLTEDRDSPEPAPSPRRRFVTILVLITIGLLAIAAAVFGVIHQVTGHATSAQAQVGAPMRPSGSEQLAEAQ